MVGRWIKKASLPKRNVSLPLDRSVWVNWPPPANIVTGEGRRQHEFVEAFGEPRPEGYLEAVPVALQRESENPHDSNAVKVVLYGRHVGYLPKQYAEVISPELDGAGISEFQVVGLVRGGDSDFNKSSFGLHLWPDRRLTPGPAIPVDAADERSTIGRWPPFAREGRPGFDVDCAECASFQITESGEGWYRCKRCGAETRGQ